MANAVVVALQQSQVQKLFATSNPPVLANYWRKWRAIGGALMKTDTALVFYPNRVEKLFGESMHSYELSTLKVVRNEVGKIRGLQLVKEDGSLLIFTVASPLSLTD